MGKESSEEPCYLQFLQKYYAAVLRTAQVQMILLITMIVKRLPSSLLYETVVETNNLIL
jgi:hypothetical protein